MKSKKRIILVVVYSMLLLVLASINLKLNFITIPAPDEMISRQINYITISTVFIGFSFTALGLLLGLSSEKLIEKIKNTGIIMDKVGRIISSIVGFILSVVISLVFVLGLNHSLINNINILSVVDSFLYVLSVGYLIGGIVYFICAVFELYDLIKRVYRYNKQASARKIAIVKAELESTSKKMHNQDMNIDDIS